MNKRTISILLALALAFLVGLPGALALPEFLTAFQKVYTDGSCGTCHIDPAGGGDRNTYGTMFENQPNHATDPVAALQAIGPAPGTSPLATATPTATATENVTATPTVTVTAPTPTAPTSKLTLTLNNTMDGTSPPLVNNITSAVLLDTSGNNVETATLPDNMTAQFNLSGISPGDYFIEVNGFAGDHLPTRIDSNASDINQSVGLRLRNSVIGDISNPAYRIKVYPLGNPPVVNSSHPVVNYATGANESTYGYVIVNDSIKKLEVRVLDTAQLLSNFTPTTDPHPGSGFASEPFNIWILGDIQDSTGAFIGNHGHLYNASNDLCSGCHGNATVKLTNYSDITPPFASSPAGGWCFKCHNGPGGPRNGFVDPIAVVAANSTIAGNVTNASSGLAISGANVTANGMMATTDANGSYNIGIAAGTYNVTANATGYQTNTTTGVVVTPGNMTIQDFTLTPTAALPPSNATFNISGFKINDTNGNGVWDPGETGIANWNVTLSDSMGTLIDRQSTDSTGLYQFMNVSPGTYNVTEEMNAGFNSTNATSMPVTVENMDVMNVNFTNQPVAPTATPTITATVTPTPTATETPNVTATPTPTITPTAQNLLIQNAQQQIQNAGQLIQIAGELIQIALQQIQSAQQQIQIAQQIQNASSGT